MFFNMPRVGHNKIQHSPFRLPKYLRFASNIIRPTTYRNRQARRHIQFFKQIFEDNAFYDVNKVTGNWKNGFSVDMILKNLHTPMNACSIFV